MKITYLVLTLVLCTAAGHAQRAIVAEGSRPVERTMKNAPYSADAISTSVQQLADGSKVTRTTNSRIYRDSEGRYRREDMPKEMGVGGALIEVPESISITDPVAGVRYQLNSKKNIAVQSKIGSGGAGGTFGAVGSGTSVTTGIREGTPTIRTETTGGGGSIRMVRPPESSSGEVRASGGERVMIARPTDPASGEVRATTGGERVMVARPAAPGPGGAGAGGAIITRSEGPTVGGMVGGAKRDVKTENLGTKTIEGVEVEGTRTTTTIPTGSMGNDHPIETVYERWYSKELGVTVLSRSTNPSFGEQTYRMINISRENPPLSLFAPPAGYTIVNEAETQPTLSPRTPSSAPTKKPEN